LDGDVFIMLGNRVCGVEMKGTESYPCPVEVLGIISFELLYSTTRVSFKSVLTLNAKNIAAAIYLPCHCLNPHCINRGKYSCV